MTSSSTTQGKSEQAVPQACKGHGRRQPQLTPQQVHAALKEVVRQGQVGQDEHKVDFRRGRIWA